MKDNEMRNEYSWVMQRLCSRSINEDSVLIKYVINDIKVFKEPFLYTKKKKDLCEIMIHDSIKITLNYQNQNLC